MEIQTWSDEAWRGAVRLCAQMEEDGFRPVFPNSELAEVDWFIYGDRTCQVCGVMMALFPFWDGEEYQLYSLCLDCGRIRRI